jgi:hypothetical protein
MLAAERFRRPSAAPRREAALRATRHHVPGDEIEQLGRITVGDAWLATEM